MIPKVIHFCWLSDDPFPPKIQYCLDSWKRALPDYEVKLWNFERFPREKSQWVREAFDARKYAFASDYIRFYALYTEGGIYLDSDVEVLKPFDELLDCPYMMGRESSSGQIEAAVIGAEKGFAPFKKMLDYYDSKPFVKPDGSFEDWPAPMVMRDVLTQDFRYKTVENKSEFDYSEDTISLYPSDYFSPVHLNTMKMEKTERTFSIHPFCRNMEIAVSQIKKARAEASRTSPYFTDNKG